MYKLNAILKSAENTKVISEKFSKREFVVETMDEKYPQVILFQLVNDKCGLLDTISNGEEVEISFNLRGREWTNPEGVVRVFNSLDAFDVKVSGPQQPKAKPQKIAVESDDEGDLPF